MSRIRTSMCKPSARYSLLDVVLRLLNEPAAYQALPRTFSVSFHARMSGHWSISCALVLAHNKL
jgi:hypothetical protein